MYFWRSGFTNGDTLNMKLGTILLVTTSQACFSLYKMFGFYRAMHFSAKRGLAIACRLSVCL